jgi:hypothetical protein
MRPSDVEASVEMGKKTTSRERDWMEKAEVLADGRRPTMGLYDS